MAKKIRTSYDFESIGSILNCIIQVSGSDPVSPTPAEGQIYYNSGTNRLRTYNGSTWDEYQVGVVGLIDQDYGDITVGGSGTTMTINDDAVTYAKMQNVVANNVFLGNNSGAGGIVDELTGTEATAMLDVFTDSLKGLVPASGGGTTTFLRADGTFATPAGGFADFDAGGDSGANVTVDSGDLFDIVGDTAITTTISKAATTVTLSIDLDDTAVTPGSYGLAGSVSQFTVDQQGRITTAANVAISITESQISNLGATVTMNADTDVSANGWVIDEDNMASDDATKVPTQQSVKAYVDNAVTGSLTYIGGYNAATNTPDLDTSPSGISQGDVYTVTADGTFFTEDVQIGDMLVAEQDNPTLLSHWTVVNKNIPDIVSASETEEGILELATQVETDTGTDDARAVTPLKLHTYLGTDDSNLNSAVRYTEQIGNGAATNIVVTHNIGRQFVVAQVFETASPYAQIECDIEMDSTTATSFTFNAAPSSNEYTVVIVG